LILGFGFDIWSVAFSPSSNLIASGDFEGRLSLWPLEASELPVEDAFREDPEKSWNATGPHHVAAIEFSSNGTVVATQPADEDGVVLWNANTGRCLRTLRGEGRRDGPWHPTWVDAITFSPDGSSLAMVALSTEGSDLMGIELWHVDGQEPYMVLQHGKFLIDDCDITPALTFSPNGTFIAVSDNRGQGVVDIWNVRNGGLVKTLNVGGQAREHARPRACFCSFSPDSSLLATCIRRTLHIWCTRTWQELDFFNPSYEVPKGNASALKFVPLI
jgi:WD40 repeat protein